jgi:hypothetical protein
VTEATAPSAEPKSATWLVLRVFDEPTKVFRELAVRPRVLLPMVLLVLATGVFAIGTPTEVLRDQTRSRLEAMQERGQLTDEQVQQRVDAAASSTSRAVIFGAGAVGGLVALVVVSAVLMLVMGATAPEPIKFKGELAVVAHANVVSIAGGVLIVALMVVGGLDQPQLSLGFLFNQDSGFLYRFANQVTLFGTWNMILVVLGNRVLTKAKGIGGPLVIIGGLWVLVKIVIAAIGGIAGFGA